ncbi:MAG: hypothetical protein ABFS34_03540 [Gemmatimonadota bacterium]
MTSNNFELLLASMTVLAVSLIPLLSEVRMGSETIVLTAIIVALLQGLLLAAARARRRKDRAAGVQEVRRMLQDQVKGQLSRITMAATAGDDATTEQSRLQSEVLGAVDNLTLLVDGLSEESLRTWRSRYAAANRHPVVAGRQTEG